MHDALDGFMLSPLSTAKGGSKTNREQRPRNVEAASTITISFGFGWFRSCPRVFVLRSFFSSDWFNESILSTLLMPVITMYLPGGTGGSTASIEFISTRTQTRHVWYLQGRVIKWLLSGECDAKSTNLRSLSKRGGGERIPYGLCKLPVSLLQTPKVCRIIHGLFSIPSRLKSMQSVALSCA